jgi:hypothetical protein
MNLALCCLITPNVFAQNDWYWGVELQRVTNDYEVYGVELEMDSNVIAFDLGYNMVLSDSWSWRPSISLGKGINEDENNEILVFGDILADISGQVKTVVSMRSTLAYAFNQSSEIWIIPSVTRYDFLAESQSIGDVSDANWRAGLGIGYGYQISQRSKLGLTYQRVDNSDIIAVNLGFSF